MVLGEGVLVKAGLYLGLADRDAAGLRSGEEACWRVHTSPRASCSTSWALARADLGQTRRSASESHDTPCALRHAVYVPTERPPVSRLYVVFQGVCRYMGRTLARGYFKFVCTNLDTGKAVRMPPIFKETYVMVSEPVVSV